MLENLKETGKAIGHEISHTWDLLSDGWREVFSRSRNALIHFVGGKEISASSERTISLLPRWSLLAGEVEETANEFVISLEAPGMSKENLRGRIDGNLLILSGEKQLERSSDSSSYHVMERAYGAFERAVALPGSVIEEKAQAHYKNGVFTVRLPKRSAEPAITIPVS